MVDRKYNFRLSQLQQHLLCWGLFIAYEVLVAYSFSGKLSSFFDYAGHYLLNIGLFYFTVYFTFKNYIGGPTHNYLLLLLFIALEFIVYMLLKKCLYLILIYYGIYSQANMPVFESLVIQGLWRFIYFIGISTGFWLSLSRLRQREVIAALEKQKLIGLMEKGVMEKELLLTENSYLKAQINPHFLFNALGFIHNQVYKISRPAGEIITLLADMMRYSISNPHLDNRVPLSSEVQHIENFILINQYRFDHKLDLSFTYEGGTEDARIVPLLLITIVENVFKHGKLIGPDFPATIQLNVADDVLSFAVQNQKADRKETVSSGIGMSNVLKRLKLHYGTNYDLQIVDSKYAYQLNLTITLAHD